MPGGDVLGIIPLLLLPMLLGVTKVVLQKVRFALNIVGFGAGSERTILVSVVISPLKSPFVFCCDRL